MRDVPPRSRTRPPRLVPAIAAVAPILGGLAAASAEHRDGSGDRARARNVILFAGDGMGVAHRDAGTLATVGLEGELVMDGPPYGGLVRTDSADPGALVTTRPPG